MDFRLKPGMWAAEEGVLTSQKQPDSLNLREAREDTHDGDN